MILNQTAEHALRAVLLLAQRRDEIVSSQEIAEALGAPPNYLAKTLSALAARGIVKGRRGPRGGYRLDIEPDDLTIERVTEGFTAVPDMPVCLLGARPCDPDRPCEAHVRWTRVRERALRPLRETTVADLLADRLEVVRTA